MKIKGTNKAATIKLAVLTKYGLTSTDAYAIKKGNEVEAKDNVMIDALIAAGFVKVLGSGSGDGPKKTTPPKRELIDNEDKETDDENVRDN